MKRTILTHHNIDAINPQKNMQRSYQTIGAVAGPEPVGIAGGKLGLRFYPLRSDDEATNGNINWHARAARLWNGGAFGSRSGSRSSGLPTNQGGLSARGFYECCRPGT